MAIEAEIIRSRQNRGVVELCKLTDRKEREKQRLFRFDGVKLLEEALTGKVSLTSVFLREDAADRVTREILCRADLSDVRVCVLENSLFDRISEEKSPDGVICVAKYIDKFQKNVTIYNNADFSSMSGERVVLLESVRDPSNIGAVIRSAAAMGVDRLIISRDCADVYHPKAVRASMGTLFRQRIDRAENLPEVVRGLRDNGRRVFAATLNSDARLLGSFVLRRGDCVVIGNEGHGLSDATVAACDGSIIIPMSERAESLNAAVAASILMWEFSKV